LTIAMTRSTLSSYVRRRNRKGTHDTMPGEVAVLAVEIVVAVAVLVAVAFVASRPDVGGLDDEDTDHGDIGLPHGRLLRSDDIRHLRFRAVSGWRGTIRGYRFGDVDAAMGKVEEALRAHEQRHNEAR
jgi:hypothetical protein